MTLSSVLQREISSCGVSVRQTARASGVNHAVLLRFVSGERTITLETADRLAGHFGYVLKREKWA